MANGLKVALLIVVATIALSGCMQNAKGVDEDNSTPTESSANAPAANDAETEKNGNQMSPEEMEVLAAYEMMQQAMVDKNVDVMRALTAEDKTFTHMSGKTQTREQFFGEIADGTLNYYAYRITNPFVTVNGDHAMLAADVMLDANAYGMPGSWTLHVRADFEKRNGAWIQVNEN